MGVTTVESMEPAVIGELLAEPMLEPMEDLAGIMLEPARTLRALGEMLQLHQLPLRQVDGDWQRAKRPKPASS